MGDSFQKSKNIYKAILQNISKKSEELRQECEKYLLGFDQDLKSNLSALLQKNSKLAEIFHKHITEYYSWHGAFESLIKTQQYVNNPIYKDVKIDEILVPLIAKISNLNNPHNDNMMNLATASKKKQWDKQFLKKWGQMKKQKYEKKISMIREKIPPPPPEPIKETQKEPPQEPQKSNINTESKYFTELNQNKQRGKSVAESYRKKRIERAKKYLQYISGYHSHISQGTINFSAIVNNGNIYVSPQNQDSLATELVGLLERYLMEKIRQTLHIAKIRHDGYKSEFIGNQFRVYGSNGEQNIKSEIKTQLKLPVFDHLKFIKLTLPSKLEKYAAIRREEYRYEDGYKKAVKDRMIDMDKKSDKFLQQYTLLDDEKRDRQQFQMKRDSGPSKTTRLKITAGCVQWVIENDSFFKDSWLMERTLIND